MLRALLAVVALVVGYFFFSQQAEGRPGSHGSESIQVSSPSPALQAEQPSHASSGKDDGLAVLVTFSRLVPVGEVIETAERINAAPIELLYYTGTLQGGFTLPTGTSLWEVPDLFCAKHLHFLDYAILEVEREISFLTDADAHARLTQLRMELERARNEAEAGQVLLSAIRVKNNVSTWSSLSFVASTAACQRLAASTDLSNVGLTPARGSGTGGTINSYSHEPWAPYSGSSHVTQSLAFSSFYFNLYGQFPSNGTYEQETQVNNLNFANYDNYWSSNLPMAYKDTQFLDTTDNFTVGSAYAAAIQPFVQYYTFMSLRPAGVSSATVRIKGQKGYRFPSSCYSTWCINPLATTGSMATFTAPAWAYWQY